MFCIITNYIVIFSPSIASSFGNSKNNQRNSSSSDKVPSITKEILEKKLSSQNRIQMHNSNGSTQDFLRTPEAGVAGYVNIVFKCENILQCCFLFHCMLAEEMKKK